MNNTEMAKQRLEATISQIDELCREWDIDVDAVEYVIELQIAKKVDKNVRAYANALLSMVDSPHIKVYDFDFEDVRTKAMARNMVRQAFAIVAKELDGIGDRYCDVAHNYFPTTGEFDENHDKVIISYCSKKAKSVHSELTRLKKCLVLDKKEVGDG